MVIEFILGAALVIMSTVAPIIWVASVTRGLRATLAVGGVMTIAVLFLLAHAATGVTLLECLQFSLVIRLLVVPIIAISFADWRRAKC